MASAGSQFRGRPEAPLAYSHSIVAGGLEEMS